LQHAGDLSDRIFVVDQIGVIRVFQNDASVNSTKIFLDLNDRVYYGGEAGLLGLAFHPDYENNGYFYVNYIADNPLRTVISRFTVSSSNPDYADKNSEFIILEFNQPFENHNGGQITFGNDGFLYIATGDGGSGGDPQNNAQNISVLLGKILRIDVDNIQPPLNYGIPSTNPFIDSLGTIRKEIYAYGLRNPWRFSIDPITNKIWCGDVGQGDWEEIDLIVSGKNYGWRCYEGNHTYDMTNCNGIYESPIWEYSHSVGFAITGGYVYRGPNIPELYGKYIYGDYGSPVLSLEYDGINPATNTFLANLPGTIPSFGIDQNQELYLLSFNGKIYKFTPTSPLIAPSYLRVNSNISGEVNLQWKDNSNNETGFIIERETGNSNLFISIDSVEQNITVYTDIINDTANYTYRIKAFDDNNQSGYSNEASINISVIPVELTSFSASINLNNVILNWETATELNNEGFQIERKISDSWENIGYVVGNGTTTEPKSYSYTDNNIKSNGAKIYYRLKQIDLDGSFKYPQFVEVAFNSLILAYKLFQNYPNPFNPTTKINFQIPEPAEIKISIINLLGEEVKILVNEFKQAGYHEVYFNASSFSSGIYFYKLSTANYSDSKKMIILK